MSIESIREENKEKVLAEGEKEVKRERAPGITWIKVGYRILQDNILGVAGSDITDLEQGAQEWWDSFRKKDSALAKRLVPLLSSVWFKTLLLVIKPFADKAFYNLMNRESVIEEEEEEEEEDER